MHIETSARVVIQLLLKGDHYEELCPNDEDTWYTAEEALNNSLICRLLSEGAITALKTGFADHIVCRGNW